ncbi:hypothetical protein DIPPA_35935 [Diplonema papillatum]|nr:hypothetical protein DIPPA_35935 [Diplonema papillatum]
METEMDDDDPEPVCVLFPYETFLKVDAILRLVVSTKKESIRTKDLLPYRGQLSQLLPSFLMPRDAREVFTPTSFFQRAFPAKADEAARLVAEYTERRDENGDCPAGDEEDLPFLGRASYLAFRRLFELASGGGSSELSPAMLVERDAEVKQMCDLFSVPSLDVTGELAFKRMDKDRSGAVSAFELLRVLLPEVSKHNIKHAMRYYEGPWRELKSEMQQAAAAGAAEEAEEAGGEEESGDQGDGDEELLVVSEEAYAYCKEVFESMDGDGSGSVSCREAAEHFAANENPFGRRIEWKGLDRDGNGYFSFEEFLRAYHPADAAWKVRSDLRILAETLGLPAGCCCPSGGRDTAPPASVRRRRRTDGGTPRKRAASSTRRLSNTRSHWFDARIKRLAERVAAAEKAEKAFAKSRSPQRRVLTETEMRALNQKLFQRHRFQEQETKRSERLRDEAIRKSRWYNDSKLNIDSLEELNQRLYSDVVGIRDERRLAVEASFEQSSPVRTIDPEDLQSSIQRLYTNDVQQRKQRHQLLVSSFAAPLSRPRVASPEARAVTTTRLYHQGIEKRSQKLSQLRTKYLTDAELPAVKLRRSQQREMVARLAPGRP